MHVHSSAAGPTLATSTQDCSMDAAPAQLDDRPAQCDSTQHHTQHDPSLDRLRKRDQQTSSQPTVHPPPSNLPASTAHPESTGHTQLSESSDRPKKKRKQSSANTPSRADQPTRSNTDSMREHKRDTQPADESPERPHKLTQTPGPRRLATATAPTWEQPSRFFGREQRFSRAC